MGHLLYWTNYREDTDHWRRKQLTCSEHAGNAAMLKAIGITHVVSVGESLLNSQPDHDPMYGLIGPNTLGNEAKQGTIQVLDLTDIRDDGNDPLRPLIARACKWIEEARKEGGVVLVHCVSFMDHA